MTRTTGRKHRETRAGTQHQGHLTVPLPIRFPRQHTRAKLDDLSLQHRHFCKTYRQSAKPRGAVLKGSGSHGEHRGALSAARRAKLRRRVAQMFNTGGAGRARFLPGAWRAALRARRRRLASGLLTRLRGILCGLRGIRTSCAGGEAVLRWGKTTASDNRCGSSGNDCAAGVTRVKRRSREALGNFQASFRPSPSSRRRFRWSRGLWRRWLWLGGRLIRECWYSRGAGRGT
jgi:hypothetical protein